MIVNVLIEPGPPNWCASSADDGLGGVVAATGQSRDDVIREFKSALAFHIEGLKLSGIELPVIDGLDVHELVPV